MAGLLRCGSAETSLAQFGTARLSSAPCSHPAALPGVPLMGGPLQDAAQPLWGGWQGSGVAQTPIVHALILHLVQSPEFK